MSVKKLIINLSVITGLCVLSGEVSAAVLGDNDNNFTMLTSSGARIGGANDVAASWDGTLNTSVETAVVNMTLSSPSPFFGVVWDAHDVKLFGEGTYVFDACPDDGSICRSEEPVLYTMVVGEGQVGAHMLFDWNGNVNIDVINVWNVNALWEFGKRLEIGLSSEGDTYRYCTKNPDDLGCPELLIKGRALLDTEWLFVSTDIDGDGVPGIGMIDGPFAGSQASFNIRPEVSVVPVPAAVWLMSSGVLGLLGVARRRQIVS